MSLKNLKIALLSIIFIVGISSCNEEDKSPNSPNTSGIPIGTIRAKVNGTLKTADKYVKADMNNSINAVFISGTGIENNSVILTFNLGIGDFNGIGSYDLGIYDSHGLGVNAIYNDPIIGGYACTPNYTETKGKIIVTEYSKGKNIKGTFYYKAIKQGTAGNGPVNIDVTEGEFNISLE